MRPTSSSIAAARSICWAASYLAGRRRRRWSVSSSPSARRWPRSLRWPRRRILRRAWRRSGWRGSVSPREVRTVRRWHALCVLAAWRACRLCYALPYRAYSLVVAYLARFQEARMRDLVSALGRLALGGLFAAVPRLTLSIKIHGLDYDTGAPRTFYAITHKRDFDAFVPLPMLVAHRGRRALTHDVHFA